MKGKHTRILAMAVLAASLVACQKPHYVLPTTEREGFTSISAFFTSGEYNNLELAKLYVTDDMVKEGRLVIPVPYYYPETSDNATTKYMSNVRVKAEIDKNCRISPPLTLLDLNLENEFTFTDAKGETYPIIITGKRKKSSVATFVSFSLVDMFEGFVDNEARKIFLYTTDDLTSCIAEAQVSAHAEIVTDLGVARNYNDPQTIVIKAHDGTEYEYVTEKAIPTKIRNGFNKESIRQLFNVDPKSRFGTPDYGTDGLDPTIASIEGYLVVCLGDGSTPFYVHGTTGAKLGEIAVGSAQVAGITNDEAGNLLMVNRLASKGKIQIYRTSSVTAAPTLFHEYDSEEAFPTGVKIKVSGSIDSDAVITIPYIGVTGITTASKFLMLTVSGGAVTESKVVDLASAGLSWGAVPSNYAGISPASSNPADGIFTASYGTTRLDWLNSSFAISKSMGTTSDAKWAWNSNGLDCKFYNNVQYLAMLVLAHFPAWGGHPSLYIYNVTNKAMLTGEFTDSPSLVVASENIDSFNGVNADGTMSSGDVVMAQSADGFKIFIYYYDQYAGVIGGYSADCIKRK